MIYLGVYLLGMSAIDIEASASIFLSLRSLSERNRFSLTTSP
ncbi:hypothetical protein [Sphingomonas sp. CFBP 8764]|jgi:hypothetical protein|nr:hypothetical protein [Sphingomonas sp. CFBP 8764]